MYYHGARYYIPWLAKWVSPDPINSEIYNIQKGNAGKNKSREFLSLAASPYEYCYDNPITYTDTNGEQPTPNQVIYQGKTLSAVEIKGPKPSFWDKAGALAKGFAKGVLIAAAVVAVIAFTGGLGLAAIATGLTYTALTVGTVLTAKTGYELATGKEAFTGRKLGTLEKYEMGGELVGGLAGGLRTMGFGGKSATKSGSSNPSAKSTSTSTEVPQFSKSTSTEPSAFSESKSTGSELPSDRTTQYRNLTETGMNRNLGYAEGEINGMPYDSGVISSGPKDVTISEVFDPLNVNSKQQIDGEGGWLRNTDSEFKILNRLANQLGAEKGGVYPEVTGEITIVSERNFCPSCEGVINQFQQMYPNVKVNTVNGTNYK